GEALVPADLVPLGQQPAPVRRVRDAAVCGLLRRDGGRVGDRVGGGFRGREVGARRPVVAIRPPPTPVTADPGRSIRAAGPLLPAAVRQEAISVSTAPNRVSP